MKWSGSRREFVRKDGYMIMYAEPDEIEKYVKINRFLRENGVNVPEIFEVNKDYVKMEDLGDLSLYRYVKTYGALPEIYKKVIEELIKFQNVPTASIDLPVFDRQKLLNEARQFAIHVLNTSEIPKKWRTAIDYCVEKCAAQEKVLMHRDFQSTNIFLYQDSIYLIDFQDIHVGPFGFDLVSLIYDPYVMLMNSFKEELIEFYAEVSNRRIEKRSLLCCALLRLMQATSAYYRLSEQGKEWFARFKKPGRCSIRSVARELGFDEIAEGVKEWTE